ncbi:hypothetical protein Ahy_B01g054945 [Arachis hypogaea]|uniref:Uncharacterized protein n=1 Tax=Arachis hypogaea TaxID=3818 RepID=A0A445AUM3_ARAHY|nr:hypothetical protein Ahy_B01g054945 [Arachis hypogaea]
MEERRRGCSVAAEAPPPLLGVAVPPRRSSKGVLSVTRPQAELDRYLEASQIRERAVDRINNVIGTYNDLRLRIFSKHPDLFPEEFEHFDDFTVASSWERFISKIEAICRLWMADGPNNLLEKGAIPLENFKNSYKIKSELQYEANRLTGILLFMICSYVLLIAPQSASGVVLDAPEASRLLIQETMDAGFNRNHSSEVSSPVAGHLPGYMDYQVGMRPQISVERKWALGLQAMQLLQLQLSSLHQSKWRRRRRRSCFRSECCKWRRSCFSCSCPQSKCCQGRDDFGNCCVLPKSCTCSCPSSPKINSNEYIWSKANPKETKEELIDRGSKFLD